MSNNVEFQTYKHLSTVIIGKVEEMLCKEKEESWSAWNTMTTPFQPVVSFDFFGVLTTISRSTIVVSFDSLTLDNDFLFNHVYFFWFLLLMMVPYPTIISFNLLLLTMVLRNYHIKFCINFLLIVDKLVRIWIICHHQNKIL